MRLSTTISFVSGLTLLLACSHTVLKHAQNAPPNTLPAAIVFERSLPRTMLDQDLNQPTGLALDSNGYVYVCDQGNDRIVKLSGELLPVRDGGGSGAELGLLDDPLFILVDDSQGVVVSDVRNRRLERFSLELEGTDQIRLDDPDDPLRYGHPTGIAMTSDGSYRIGDRDRNRLIELDNVGVFKKFVGDLGERGGQLSAPQKVLVDSDDNVYVCDAGNSRVVVYDEYDNLLHVMMHESMSYPVAAVFDRKGNIWVLDQPTAQIFCFAPSGALLGDKPLQILGVTPPFDKPTDLTLLKDGRLLISDTGNNRLVVCTVVAAPSPAR